MRSRIGSRGSAAWLVAAWLDFELVWNTPGFRVTGTRATANVRLTRLAPPPATEPELQPYTLLARVQDRMQGGIRRPGNFEARCHRAYYDTRPPFCGCPA